MVVYLHKLYGYRIETFEVAIKIRCNLREYISNTCFMTGSINFLVCTTSQRITFLNRVAFYTVLGQYNISKFAEWKNYTIEQRFGA